VPGELVTGGEGLARGYHRRPDLTAERFVPHPFAARPGERLYRTGDRARFLPGGTVEFLGRVDTQVKVRGFRVELGEVEACLARHPAVREAAVAVRRHGAGDERLAAFVTVRDGAAAEGLAGGLRDFAGGLLPPYMVPSEVVVLPELPLTASGKADRRALAALETGHEGADRKVAAPRNTLEEILAGVWAEILRRGPVGIHDDFFELGGHSLLATRVISRVRRLFGVEVPLADLFREPTVAALAERIGPERRRSAAGGAIPRAPRDRPLPLSFSQRRL
jgi:acyl carrier protein